MPELGEIRTDRQTGRTTLRNSYVWAACLSCGKQRWVRSSYGKPLYLWCIACGKKARRGKYHSQHGHRWKGGQKLLHYGYMGIRIYPDSPYFAMANSQGYVVEGRLVLAKKLGRCLDPREIVHHINGMKKDNIEENLSLFPSRGEHRQLHRLLQQLHLLLLRLITEGTNEARFLKVG